MKATMYLTIMAAVAGLPLLAGPERALVYQPEGDAIVLRNGTRWYNRPLYCNERLAVVFGGEMPSLQGGMGTLCVAIARGDVRVPLHGFGQRVMRYRPGWLEWELADPRFPGLQVRLVGTTLADASGFTARLSVAGARAGDHALWMMFPPAGVALKCQTTDRGYQWDRDPAVPFTRICGGLSAAVAKWEQLAGDQRDHPSAAVALGRDLAAGAGLVASVSLATPEQSLVMVADDNEASVLTRLQKTMDPALAVEPAKAFDAGVARARKFTRDVAVETPDPHFNAALGASVAASHGLFVHQCFVHSGTIWRMQLPGWRTMGGAVSYGWLDQVRRAVALFDGLQVKKNERRTKPEYSPNGCHQVGDSRFFGEGYVQDRLPVAFYNFQTLMFDDAIRAWRHTADPELERRLLPMLELHLKRARECFDADDDGLYESYNNTWPNDSIWFNGGGTPEESAYMFNALRAAADMCRRNGDAAGAARHQAQADKTLAALNKVLWLPDAGHFGSFLEPGGHRRVNPNAWVYAQHVPIEAGMTTPLQAWQAMYYTEWAMERFKLPFGGEMRQSSNFVPGQWSIRELYHGDNFAMAHGYFLAGQGDDGWQILRGAMLQSMYGDLEPKRGFSQESGNFNRVNIICPGGLSHPNCGVDFVDIASPFARAVVEGLFGFRPDYPNGIVKIEPSLPAAWHHAYLKTPEFALRVRDGNIYQLTLAKPAKVRFGLPVRAAKVRAVSVNDRPAAFTIEPWAGYGMLRVDVPASRQVTVRIDTAGPVGGWPVKSEEATEGTPGYHLVCERTGGDVPRYQLIKRHVAAPANPWLLAEAPAAAKWKTIDLGKVHNGDIRTIYQQRYDSPRPATCSMRIGYDGWSAWTFPGWGIKTPEIEIERAKSPDLIGDGQLVTPQRARFLAPQAGRNIAFASLWDRWPDAVSVPVGAKGDAVWLLVCGSTNPMQCQIANAVIKFRYADGGVDTLELVPPANFWSLCGFGNVDYNYERDGFALPDIPPPQVQLGRNCRAMVYGWKLRPNIILQDVALETLSQDVVIGLMAVSVMNPVE